jgi:hypothetical protein
MKFLLIFLSIISFLFAGDDVNETNTTKKFSSEIILSKKTKDVNGTKETETFILKKFILDTYNSIMPDYLQVEPKENFFHYKLTYDPQKQQWQSQLKVNVILPSFEKTVKKSKITKISTKTKTYTFKIVPFLTMYDEQPSLVIKPSFSYTYSFNNLINLLTNTFAFSESFYYYIPSSDYKEVSQIILKKLFTLDNLFFKATKKYLSKEPTNLYYSFSVYIYNKQNKYIKIYGIQTDGERKKDPFIYSYKLFFTYRHILFNKKYFYVDLSPYYMWSKEWNYNAKFFVTTSINLKF